MQEVRCLWGSNRLWIRTLDKYTRAGLPKCVVSTMLGPPQPGITQDKGHTPRIEIKIHDPAGNRMQAAGLEGRDSTDHTKAADYSISFSSTIKRTLNSHFIIFYTVFYWNIILHYLQENALTNTMSQIILLIQNSVPYRSFHSWDFFYSIHGLIQYS